MTGVVIVKVQAALSPGGPALIYAEGRKQTEARELDAREVAMMGDAVKAFFRARLDDRRRSWSLLERVPDQPW